MTDFIPALTMTYGLCLLVFAVNAILLYALDRWTVWGRLALVWVAGGFVFVLEGIAQLFELPAAAIANAGNIIFVIPLATVLQPVTGAVAWKRSDLALLVLGMLVAAIAAAASAPFWMIAVPVVPAVIAPLLRALRGFYDRRAGLSSVERMLAVTILLFVLHKIDYPFLRPIEAVAPFGFGVAFILLLTIANLVLAAVAARQRQDRADVERRSARQASAGRRVQAVLHEDVVRARAAMQQMSQFGSVGAFAGGVAHDFSNILNVLLGNVELLERLVATEDELVQETMDAIRTSGDRASALIRRLMDVSGGGGEQLVSCDVTTEVQAAYALMQGFRREGTELTLHVDSSASITSQSGQLTRMVVNLAANAIQATAHMAEGAQVRVDVSDVDIVGYQAESLALEPGTYTEILVRDNGRGMTEEQRERAFDPFFTGRGDEGGTGLGLFVVQSIVEDLGGRVEIVSSVGRGTLVRVCLPVIGGRAPAAESRERDDATRARILVVDDDADSLHILVEFVRALGYVPEGAGSGDEALRRYLKAPDEWAAVVTDGRMSGVNGIDLLLAVRGAADTPVLMVSGDSAMLEAARDEGAAAVLAKPVTLEQLGAGLDQAVRPKGDA